MTTPPITEWEFTADVASWVNEILIKDSSLPFFRAKCEQRGADSAKRRDLTLLDDNKVVVLTGEVKLPFQKDGGSPYNETVVQDARKKAEKAKAKFFFTWNVNEFVLWETFSAKTTKADRKFRVWTVVDPPVFKGSQLESPTTIRSIQSWLTLFLNEFAGVLRGTAIIGTQLPDEKFISMLESTLKMPVLMTLEELENRYVKPKFKVNLDKWMREEQGWIIYDDPVGIRDNLDRASKFACYALVNKLVFYEALLKRYGARMTKITVPDHIDTAEELRLHLEGFFSDAKRVTRDYETVFGEDHTGIGNRIPFYADTAVPHWRELINQIHEFDFSKLDYEVIGSIFELLISPEERHKYGQFYTRPEVVDLINSFCIRTGYEKAMDMACGGGTFLVRAYARKRELAPGRKHGELLTDLYGVDISHFASHLTTINLATRDLIDDENYPQIARKDFFEVKANHRFITLPSKVHAKGLGTLQHREIEIPPLDAVIGNPPYIRQEDIPKTVSQDGKKKAPQPGTKEYYQLLINQEAGIKLSGRSDIHCYFWPHASTFLKEAGYLCFITSSQWLDVEYGFKLQDWILRHFEIVAVLESMEEPWFIGARVATAVTILRKTGDEASRMKNIVRFVQLRQPISEIMSHDGTTAGAIEAVDAFRDEILLLKKNTATRNYRVRLIPQADLWNNGVQLGELMKDDTSGGDKIDEDNDHEETIGEGGYYGGKWGVYLRAPDLWFALLDKYGERFTPLGKIADIRFGVKSGKDSFFFPKDWSSECLRKYEDLSGFAAAFGGVPRSDVESGEVKLVLCGEGRGEIKPIESEYLEPEVHSLMEVDGYTVSSKDCSRLMLLTDKNKDQLKNTYVLDYIKWGEKNNWHKGATCASRVTETREWYDLTGHVRGSLFWPKSQQYKHSAPYNEFNLQCNCNLYDITTKNEIDPMVMAGVLNSTIVVFSKFQYGRPVGVEGNLKTEVVDVKMMLVPDLTQASKESAKRVARAFEKMKKRKALQFLSERRMREMAFTQKGKEDDLSELSELSELDMPDRRELDNAVLELIGIDSTKMRLKMIEDLYGYLREFFEYTRCKEEKAILNKKRANRREKTNPAELAVQIYKEIHDNEPYLLKSYSSDFLDASKPFDTYDIPLDGVPEPIRGEMFVPHGVRFRKGKKELAVIDTKFEDQDELLILLVNSGLRGFIRIPRDSAEVHRLKDKYERFIYDREKRIRDFIEQRTVDEEIQEKVYEALVPMILHHR